MKSHRRKTLVFLHREVKNYDRRYPTALIFVLLPSHFYTVLSYVPREDGINILLEGTNISRTVVMSSVGF